MFCRAELQLSRNYHRLMIHVAYLFCVRGNRRC